MFIRIFEELLLERSLIAHENAEIVEIPML